MKPLKYILILLGIILGLRANATTTLVVSTLDGQKQVIDLADYPTVTIIDETLNIDAKNIQIRYDINQVVSFKYAEDAGIISPDNTPNIRISDTNITVSASDTDYKISVYAVSGALILTQNVVFGSEATISTSTLTPGVYIVKVNDTTFKIIR